MYVEINEGHGGWIFDESLWEYVRGNGDGIDNEVKISVILMSSIVTDE